MKQVSDIIYNADVDKKRQFNYNNYGYGGYFGFMGHDDDEGERHITRTHFPKKQEEPHKSKIITSSYPDGLKVGDYVYAYANSLSLWFHGKVVDYIDEEDRLYGVEIEAMGFDDITINPKAIPDKFRPKNFWTNRVQYDIPSEGCANSQFYAYLK